MEQTGKVLIFAGVILIVAGAVIYFAGDKLGWLGHLPGDIRIVKENFRFYFPITTMIIISVVLTLIIYIIRKIF